MRQFQQIPKFPETKFFHAWMRCHDFDPILSTDFGFKIKMAELVYYKNFYHFQNQNKLHQTMSAPELALRC